MKKIKINLKKISKKEIDFIVEYLKKGKVIIYPTDTIYGLGCMANNAKAIKKIYKIKKRKAKKPLLILVDSLKMANAYCKISGEQEKILKKAWDSGNVPRLPRRLPILSRRTSRNGIYIRPVTFILKAKSNLPKELSGEQDSMAIRLPKNDFLIKIIKRIKVPLVSTSVNISGEKPIDNVEKITTTPNPSLKRRGEKKFFFVPPFTKGAKMEMPDLVVDAGKLKGKASAIIDATDAGNIKIIRK